MSANFPNEEILKKACDKFSIDFKTANLIRWNSNLIYDCKDKVLRFTPSEVRNEKDIKTELDWINYLVSKGVNVVHLIPSTEGKYIETFNKQNGQGYYLVVCFEKIIGEKLSKKTWNTQHFQRLGSLCGRLHKLSNEYVEKPGLLYKNWNEIIEHHSYSYLPEKDFHFRKIYLELVAKFEEYPVEPHNYGLIHYDIHHENYLLTGEKIVLLDFEMTCKSWFVNDISSLLCYVDHLPKKEDPDQFLFVFLNHFWKGYEDEYQIDENEKEWIPKFILYRNILVYGYIHKIWENDWSESKSWFKEKIKRYILRWMKKI